MMKINREPFPSSLVVAAGASLAAIAVVSLVLLKKRKHPGADVVKNL
jgi:hypothetical protein